MNHLVFYIPLLLITSCFIFCSGIKVWRIWKMKWQLVVLCSIWCYVQWSKIFDTSFTSHCHIIYIYIYNLVFVVHTLYCTLHIAIFIIFWIISCTMLLNVNLFPLTGNFLNIVFFFITKKDWTLLVLKIFVFGVQGLTLCVNIILIFQQLFKYSVVIYDSLPWQTKKCYVQ